MRLWGAIAVPAENSFSDGAMSIAAAEMAGMEWPVIHSVDGAYGPCITR